MKLRANPYVRQIANQLRVQDGSRAVEILVKDSLRATPSLEALARKLGVSRIVEERLPFEGGLFRLSDGELVVKLNSESPFVRKRFTLAHEIGHLLLGKPGLRSSCGNDRDLERACDCIASELLMPSEDTTAFVQSLGQPSPDKLKMVAAKYTVSVHAAAIRVHTDLRLWKCFIGLWERHPQIKTAWFVGRRRWDRTEPDSYSLDLALSSDTPVQSKELWQRGPSADPVWLKLLRTEAGRVLGLVGFVN